MNSSSRNSLCINHLQKMHSFFSWFVLMIVKNSWISKKQTSIPSVRCFWAVHSFRYETTTFKNEIQSFTDSEESSAFSVASWRSSFNFSIGILPPSPLIHSCRSLANRFQMHGTAVVIVPISFSADGGWGGSRARFFFTGVDRDVSGSSLFFLDESGLHCTGMGDPLFTAIHYKRPL